MKTSVCLWILTLFLCSALSAKSNDDRSVIEVKSVEGRAIIRQPLGKSWIEIEKGQQLKIGWILQIMDGGAVELSFRSKIHGKNKNEKEFYKMLDKLNKEKNTAT